MQKVTFCRVKGRVLKGNRQPFRNKGVVGVILIKTVTFGVKMLQDAVIC